MLTWKPSPYGAPSLQWVKLLAAFHYWKIEKCKYDLMCLIINPEQARFRNKKRFCVAFMGFNVLFTLDIVGLAQDCSNSIANALELQQSCAKPSVCFVFAGGRAVGIPSVHPLPGLNTSAVRVNQSASARRTCCSVGARLRSILCSSAGYPSFILH